MEICPAAEIKASRNDPGLNTLMNTDVTFPCHNDGTKNMMSDFIGANHIWSDYTLLGMDSLTEGGARTTELGSSTLKYILLIIIKAIIKQI